MKYLRVLQEYYYRRCAWDTSNEFENGDALTRILVQPGSLESPKQDNILRKKCSRTVAFLIEG